MPDLISHIGAGYLFSFNYRKRAWMALFLFATVLPDMATRPFYIAFPQIYWFIKPLHTPLGILLLCLLISGFFVRKDRNRAFVVLMFGSFLHLAFDLLQKHAHGGYPLFFPFSWKTWEVGVLWPEEMLYFMPMWIGIIGFMIVWRKRSQPSKTSSSETT